MFIVLIRSSVLCCLTLISFQFLSQIWDQKFLFLAGTFYVSLILRDFGETVSFLTPLISFKWTGVESLTFRSEVCSIETRVKLETCNTCSAQACTSAGQILCRIHGVDTMVGNVF